jgi:hypothetical protein
MAVNDAQSGYSPETRNYLEKSLNSVYTNGLNTASRLGGDPNSIADILERASNSVLKMGSDDALMQYNKMAGVVSSVKDLADQRVAEWASVQNNLKDDMAAEAMKSAAGAKNTQSGLGLFTSAVANYDMGNLYGTKKPATKYANPQDYKSKMKVRITSPTAEEDYPNPL